VVLYEEVNSPVATVYDGKVGRGVTLCDDVIGRAVTVYDSLTDGAAKLHGGIDCESANDVTD
jgi:hypothetical protein